MVNVMIQGIHRGAQARASRYRRRPAHPGFTGSSSTRMRYPVLSLPDAVKSMLHCVYGLASLTPESGNSCSSDSSHVGTPSEVRDAWLRS